MTELQKCCDYLYVIDNGFLVNKGETKKLLDGLISRYTITATNIETSRTLQPYLVAAEKNTASIKCSSEHIPAILQNVLEEGFAVTSCVPDITLEQLVIPLAQ